MDPIERQGFLSERHEGDDARVEMTHFQAMKCIHADAMMGHLRAFGIDLGGARKTALRGLVQELPPTLVANALGYSYQVIHKHAADAGVLMARYAGKGAPPR